MKQEVQRNKESFTQVKKLKQEKLHFYRKDRSPTFSGTQSKHWELCERRISSRQGPFVYIWKIRFLMLIFGSHLQCTCIFQMSMSLSTKYKMYWYYTLVYLTYCTCRHCHNPAFLEEHTFQMPFQDQAQSGKEKKKKLQNELMVLCNSKLSQA